MTDPADFLNAFPAAAAASALMTGVLSSLSPCTVASVPLVVGYVGGYSDGTRRRAFLFSLSFVFGTALSFTLIGLAVALAGTFFLPMGDFWEVLLASLAFLAGVSLLVGYQIPGIQYRQCGSRPGSHWRGAFGAFLAGGVSGLAFAPCATPIVVGILALIGNQQDIFFGTVLMFFYAMGHGALLLFAGTSIGFARWMANAYWAALVNRYFSRLAGALLVGYAAHLGYGLLFSR